MGQNNSKLRRKQRQDESTARSREWAALTNVEKLERLTNRGYGDSVEAKKYVDIEAETE